MFIWFFFIIAFGRGNLLVIGSNFSILFKKLHFKQFDGTIVLEFFLLSGLIGSVFYNTYLSKKGEHKKYLLIYTIFGVLCFGSGFIFYFY